MGDLSKIRRLFGRHPVAVPAGAPRGSARLAGRRDFAAADAGNLFAGWARQGRTTDVLLRQQLEAVRSRSRDLARNSDYARSFLRQAKKHVVGPSGVQLQVRARNPDGKLDLTANAAIEAAWLKFGRAGAFEASGRLSRIDAEALFIQTVLRDGECFVRMVAGCGGPFNWGVEFIAADRCDVNLDRQLPNGNRIYLGVESNSWGRPVAYWFLTSNPNGERFDGGSNRYVRYPAENMIHGFLAEDIDQSRGIPAMVAGMSRLKMLSGYEEAELVAARVAASKMGFYQNTSDTYDEAPAGELDADEGEFVDEATPGSFPILPRGWEFKEFDPQHPNSAFADFSKQCLRGFAAGVGASYNSIANDLTGVNYSSIRHGAQEERDEWRMLQYWMIEHFNMPIFEHWLAWCLDMGILGNLPPSKYDKFNAPIFRPRGWRWVDPAKEMTGFKSALSLGVTSRTAIAAEQGRDIEDIFAELAAERELAAQYGIALTGDEPADLAAGGDLAETIAANLED